MLKDKIHQKQKILELSSNNLKRKLGRALSHNSLFFLFLKILLIFVYTMLPIIAHNIINIEHGANLQNQGFYDEGKDYITAAQAIGYSQPMVFFSTTSLTVIGLSVINFLRRGIDTKNKRNQPKEIINSGLVYVFITAIVISILLICVMMLYANVVLDGYEYDTKESLQKYLMEYSSMMPLFILFTGLSLYFEMLTIECGVNYWGMLSLSTFFLITDIVLAYIFNEYTNLNPIISVFIGTTTSVIVRFIVFASIFYTKIAKWRFWEIRPYLVYIKNIWNASWIICTYMLMYSLMMLVQIMFMSLIILDKSNAYMIVDGHYLLIITRIGVYNIINLIIIIPKSMSNALIVKYRNSKSTPKERLKSFEISRRFSIITIWSMFFIGLIIWCFSDNIVDLIYGGISWTEEYVPAGYPVKYFGENIQYIDIMRDFFRKGLLFGIIAQFMVQYSIYYRVISYNFLKRDKKNFLFIMIVFALCYGVGNYILGVYLQHVFRGIVGFMLTLFIYGVLASIIVRISTYRNKRKTYNELLEKQYDDHLEQWWTMGPINYFKKLRYYKRIVMTDCVVKYI